MTKGSTGCSAVAVTTRSTAARATTWWPAAEATTPWPAAPDSTGSSPGPATTGRTAGPGNDLVVGGWGDDVTNGGDGDDLMFANRGVDVHNGGEGNDRLWALARRDKLAADGTGDTLNGGPGNDTFRTRDGQPDKIDCGRWDRQPVTLAAASGIDAAKLPACLAGGMADSTLLQRIYPQMLARAFEPPRSYGRQLLKDMKAVKEFAHGLDLDLPLVELAVARFAVHGERGGAMRDSAAVVDLYPRKS